MNRFWLLLLRALTAGLVAVLVVVAQPARAQSARGSLTAFLTLVEPNRHLSLRLLRFTGAGFAPTDSVVLTTDGAQRPLLAADTAAGLYLLAFDKYSRTELVLAPGEATHFAASVPQLARQGVYLEDSPENAAYYPLLALVQHYDTLISQLHEHLAALPDTAAYQRAGAARLLERYHRNLNLQLRQRAAAAPGTFAARVVAPLAETPERPAADAFTPGYLAWLRAHCLDNFPLTTDQPLRHYLGAARVQYAVFGLSDGVPGGAVTYAAARRAAADALLARRQGHDGVNAWLGQTLVAAALRADDQALVRHLALDYAADGTGGCAPALPPALAAQLARAKALAPGQPAPDLVLPDSAGRPQSLRAFARRYRYTVFYGWVSWCHTCVAEAPALAKLQAESGPQKLGVYAAALDETRAPWLAAVRAEKLPAAWCHVARLGPLAQNEAAQLFQIRLTPRIALLDARGRLVGLYRNVAELAAAVR